MNKPKEQMDIVADLSIIQEGELLDEDPAFQEIIEARQLTLEDLERFAAECDKHDEDDLYYEEY